MYQYGVIGLWLGLAVILCYNGQMGIYKRAVCEVFVLRILSIALGFIVYCKVKLGKLPPLLHIAL